MALITALLLIAAALIDLFSRIGVLTVPQQYQMYPGYGVLFIGLCILIQGLHQILVSRNERIAIQNRISAKENYDNQMNEILAEQRQQKQNARNTIDTGEVVYDEDTI